MLELNNTNCREYTENELAVLLGLDSIEDLTKALKANMAKMKKVDYKTEDFKLLAKNDFEIKTKIVDLIGLDGLTQILIGKKRTDGKFKQLNSAGNGYGNL